MAVVNKFSGPWQALRVKVKGEKTPSKKILMVLNFLENNPTRENRERVRNFLAMTKVAYKDESIRQEFDDGLATLDNADQYKPEDRLIGPEVLSDEDLIAVKNDLKKRRYDFQFKGKAPKDHIDFMDKLETEMKKRKLI